MLDQVSPEAPRAPTAAFRPISTGQRVLALLTSLVCGVVAAYLTYGVLGLFLFSFLSWDNLLATVTTLGTTCLALVITVRTYRAAVAAMQTPTDAERSRWDRGPGISHTLLVGIVCLGIAVVVAAPQGGQDYLVFIALALGLLILGVVWTAQLLWALGQLGATRHLVSARFWLAAPAIVIATFTFATWDGAQHLGFTLQRAHMTSHAERVLANVDRTELEQGGFVSVGANVRVGALRFDRVNVQADCTREGRCDPDTARVFYSSWAPVFAELSYVYSPTAPLRAEFQESVEHLGGDWWFHVWSD